MSHLPLPLDHGSRPISHFLQTPQRHGYFHCNLQHHVVRERESVSFNSTAYVVKILLLANVKRNDDGNKAETKLPSSVAKFGEIMQLWQKISLRHFKNLFGN